MEHPGQIRRYGAGFAFTLTRAGITREWWFPTFDLAQAACRKRKKAGWG